MATIQPSFANAAEFFNSLLVNYSASPGPAVSVYWMTQLPFAGSEDAQTEPAKVTSCRGSNTISRSSSLRRLRAVLLMLAPSVASGHGVASDRTAAARARRASCDFRPANAGLAPEGRFGSEWPRSGSTARTSPPWPRLTIPTAPESTLPPSPGTACAYSRPARR